jgi:hypothetical protein
MSLSVALQGEESAGPISTEISLKADFWDFSLNKAPQPEQ